MSQVMTLHNDFSAGALDASIRARPDTRAFASGAASLINVAINPSGGIYRRPGLTYTGIGMRQQPRFLSATDLDGNPALMMIDASWMTIAKPDLTDITLIDQRDHPYTNSQIDELNAVSLARGTILCHANHPPLMVTLDRNEKLQLNPFSFAEDPQTSTPRLPWVPVPQTGNISSLTITDESETRALLIGDRANIDPFPQGHLLRYNDVIYRVDEPSTEGLALDRLGLLGTPSIATRDVVHEPMFSERLGWPSQVALHQGRLVLGNSRTFPHWLIFSRTGQINDFDPGQIDDTDAIILALPVTPATRIDFILSAQQRLLVADQSSLWAIEGDPLTPASTSVRIVAKRPAPTTIAQQTAQSLIQDPQDSGTILTVNNTIVMIGDRNAQSHVYSNTTQGFVSHSLNLLNQDIVRAPKRAVFDSHHNRLLVLRGDGSLAVCLLNDELNVAAWSHWTTDGSIHDLLFTAGRVWCLTQRSKTSSIPNANAYDLEFFDTQAYLDSATRVRWESGDETSPSIIRTPPELIDQPTVVLAIRPREQNPPHLREDPQVVETIVETERTPKTLTVPYRRDDTRGQMGRPFSVLITPLPPFVRNRGSSGGIGDRIRLRRLTLRLHNSTHAQVEILHHGTVVHQVVASEQRQYAPDDEIPPYSGDFSVSGAGWQTLTDRPLWQLRQIQCGPLHVRLVIATLSIFPRL